MNIDDGGGERGWSAAMSCRESEERHASAFVVVVMRRSHSRLMCPKFTVNRSAAHTEEYTKVDRSPSRSRRMAVCTGVYDEYFIRDACDV